MYSADLYQILYFVIVWLSVQNTSTYEISYHNIFLVHFRTSSQAGDSSGPSWFTLMFVSLHSYDFFESTRFGACTYTCTWVGHLYNSIVLAYLQILLDMTCILESAPNRHLVHIRIIRWFSMSTRFSFRQCPQKSLFHNSMILHINEVLISALPFNVV